MDILELVDDAHQYGGGTYRVENWEDYDFVPLNLSSGYYVSAAGGIEKATDLFVGDIYEFLRGLDLDNEHLGLWRDEKGKWSIDRTVWFYDREAAADFGRLQYQRAIWDIANGVAITL